MAAGAFCSSAEELGLLGEMLKSDSKGASVAATFLQGYALQVCHVRHLMAILNSSDDVQKLKACLQEAEKPAVSTNDRGVWLQRWLHLFGVAEAPASLAAPSNYSKVLLRWATNDAQRAKKRLEAATRATTRGSDTQRASGLERLEREKQAECQPVVLPGHQQSSRIEGGTADAAAAEAAGAGAAEAEAEVADADADAAVAAAAPKMVGGEMAALAAAAAAAEPQQLEGAGITAAPAGAAVAEAAGAGAAEVVDADANAAAAAAAPEVVGGELAVLAAAAADAEPQQREETVSAAAPRGEESPREQRLRTERERANKLCWELRKELEKEREKGEMVSPH